MAKGLVIYYSRSGNTKAMAHAIAEGMQKSGLATKCKSVTDTKVDELLDVDVIVVGSPTYYGRAAGPIATFFDESVSKHGKLDGKLGAAFSSSANVAGANETTVCELNNMLLVHGMIIQGSVTGNHYGPVSINKPDQQVRKQCYDYGQKVANLTKRIIKQQEVPTL